MKKHIKILKKKLKNFNTKLKEECGVFGVSNAKDASALTALGLHALQHRGRRPGRRRAPRHGLDRGLRVLRYRHGRGGTRDHRCCRAIIMHTLTSEN